MIFNWGLKDSRVQLQLLTDRRGRATSMSYIVHLIRMTFTNVSHASAIFDDFHFIINIFLCLLCLKLSE